MGGVQALVSPALWSGDQHEPSGGLGTHVLHLLGQSLPGHIPSVASACGPPHTAPAGVVVHQGLLDAILVDIELHDP